MTCSRCCTCLVIQKLLKRAGKDGKTTVFLLTDTQIKEEAFLEDVDGLLNAGEVPNLFPLDERAEIIEVCIVIITIHTLAYTYVLSLIGC